ncbi:unnamed protein product, partial [Prorocentrum cordatum]
WAPRSSTCRRRPSRFSSWATRATTTTNPAQEATMTGRIAGEAATIHGVVVQTRGRRGGGGSSRGTCPGTPPDPKRLVSTMATTAAPSLPSLPNAESGDLGPEFPDICDGTRDAGTQTSALHAATLRSTAGQAVSIAMERMVNALVGASGRLRRAAAVIDGDSGLQGRAGPPERGAEFPQAP